MSKKLLLLCSIVFVCNAPFSFAAGISEPKEVTKANTNIVKKVEEKKPDVVEITKAWARKSMSSNNNSAAYMVIDNKTDKDIAIIGASSIEVANNVELHNSFVDEKGISRMTGVDKIVVPAKSLIELKPGSLHIMLFDLKKSLNSGDKFSIDLKIEGSTPLKVEATVE